MLRLGICFMTDFENFCNVCLRRKVVTDKSSVCRCNGIQTYSLSTYTGEFRMTKSHPDGDGEIQQYYKREDVDNLLKKLKKYDTIQ